VICGFSILKSGVIVLSSPFVSFAAVYEVSPIVRVLLAFADLISVHRDYADQSVASEILIMAAAKHDLMCVPLVVKRWIAGDHNYLLRVGGGRKAGADFALHTMNSIPNPCHPIPFTLTPSLG
jgi:hypothetical protein